MRRLILSTLPWVALGAAGAGVFVAFKYGPAPDYIAAARTQLETTTLDVSAAAGMRLKALTVEGRTMTTPDDLLGAMDVERGAPILSIDVAQARVAIEKLPWVKTAKVERRLPATVHIIVEERTPYALWQHGEHYTLVDRTGKAIVDVPGADEYLPLIVGPDAPEHAAALFEALFKEPDIAERVRAAVRVGERRWNVYLDAYDTGIAIRLPEDNIAAAWTRLAGLQRDHKILERDLEFIDLRLEDRLIVRVHKNAAPSAPATSVSAPVQPQPPAAPTGPKQDI